MSKEVKVKSTRLTAREIYDIFGNSDVKNKEDNLGEMRRKLNWLREHKWDSEYTDKVDEIENLILDLEEKITVANREINVETKKFSDIHGGASSRK